MTLNTQHLVEWFPIYADATATKSSPRDVAGWKGQRPHGCCCSRWSQQPQSACGASPACSTGQVRLQEHCWVCQAHPWACGVPWDAASLPVQGLSTSHSWQEARGRQGHHYTCLHSDIINNFKLLWDSEVRKGIFSRVTLSVGGIMHASTAAVLLSCCCASAHVSSVFRK